MLLRLVGKREKFMWTMEKARKNIFLIISLLPHLVNVERNRNKVSSRLGVGEKKMSRILNPDPLPSSFSGLAAARRF